MRIFLLEANDDNHMIAVGAYGSRESAMKGAGEGVAFENSYEYSFGYVGTGDVKKMAYRIRPMAVSGM